MAFMRRLYRAAPRHCQQWGFCQEMTSPTPALALQLGLLGSPPDPVGCFTMREGPSRG